VAVVVLIVEGEAEGFPRGEGEEEEEEEGVSRLKPSRTYRPDSMGALTFPTRHHHRPVSTANSIRMYRYFVCKIISLLKKD
jgi:hypothetical protein